MTKTKIFSPHPNTKSKHAHLKTQNPKLFPTVDITSTLSKNNFILTQRLHVNLRAYQRWSLRLMRTAGFQGVPIEGPCRPWRRPPLPFRTFLAGCALISSNSARKARSASLQK